MKNENRTCQECGRRLTGRSDKKFCTDMCRNTHNNRISAFRNNTMRAINHTLRKNRHILAQLCPAEKIRVTRNSLTDFNFSYFTHVRQTPRGNTCFFVYDLGYRELANGNILIIRDWPRL